jgi:hypothetical protein
MRRRCGSSPALHLEWKVKLCPQAVDMITLMTYHFSREGNAAVR